jgi:hypothetical protein
MHPTFLTLGEDRDRFGKSLYPSKPLPVLDLQILRHSVGEFTSYGKNGRFPSKIPSDREKGLPENYYYYCFDQIPHAKKA